MMGLYDQRILMFLGFIDSDLDFQKRCLLFMLQLINFFQNLLAFNNVVFMKL